MHKRDHVIAVDVGGGARMLLPTGTLDDRSADGIRAIKENV